MPDTTKPAPTQTATIFDDVGQFAVQLPPGRRLLGLDLGTKTIGLALTDVTRMIASPLETLQRKKFSHDATRLEDHIATHDVAALVLGLPRNFDGSEGPRAQSTRAFARNLARRITIPILLWDERLTTAAAERVLLEADTSRARRAEVVDQLAATLILQGVLDAIANAARR